MSTHDDVRYHRAPHVLWRRTLETIVLLPPGRDEPLALAGPGPEVWGLLAEPRSFDDVVAVLAEVHGTDPGTVGRDVEPLLAQLVDVGALARV